MRVGVEVGVNQLADFAGKAMQLDYVGSLDLPQICPATALVDAQQRFEMVQGAAMDVEGVRQQPAYG
jgi:hypothetical protein